MKLRASTYHRARLRIAERLYETHPASETCSLFLPESSKNKTFGVHVLMLNDLGKTPNSFNSIGESLLSSCTPCTVRRHTAVQTFLNPPG
jgi:hypothetical protein